jgi:phenylalanyl-tRNA synthetase beta chain
VNVLVSWLRDLVDIPVDAAALARDLHLAGFEVASVEPTATGANGSDDAVIDFEITANRPDCLSLAGLAREVATRYATALHLPAGVDLGEADPAAAGPIRVTLEDTEGCPRYCAALADVRIGPSPPWLVERLTAAGIRSISNIVDVTNYVLLETGHPLHAFDLAKLAGPEIRVRTAAAGERLTTLDGQVRTLDAGTVVIADGDRGQALGGIMGGADSEVSDGTTTIVLEAAWFAPTSIRRASRKLGLSTEASYRFERGADIDGPPAALARACALIEQIGAGTARRGWVDAYPAPRRPMVVSLTTSRVERLLGVRVPADEIERILRGLGFAVEPGDGSWRVTVPSWRIDVTRDVDLIEEVARHHGYDRLPVTFPALSATPPPPAARLEQDRALRRLATAAGFNEAVTFSFIGRREAAEFADAGDVVSLANPLSETFAVLRPSLLPGLVDSLGHNRRHGQRDVRLFELGTRFRRTTGEVRSLGLVWLGDAVAEHWSGKARPADFFDIKGVVTTIAEATGVVLRAEAAEQPFLVPGRAGALLCDTPEGPRQVGVLGQLLPALADVRDIPSQDAVFVAELDVDRIADRMTLLEIGRTRPLPRFPQVVRDLSILVDNTLPAASVRGTIQATAPVTLVRVSEFDRYQGKGIPDGRVSLSYRLTFQAADRTLTDAEVDAAMDAVVEALTRAHGAIRR